MNVQVSGLLGRIHPGLVVSAAASIAGSPSGPGGKVRWILCVLLLAVIGLMGRALARPRKA